MKFVISEARPNSYDYHIRSTESPDRKAICGDHVEVDTMIPVEAWEVRTDKKVITRWCPRCKVVLASLAARAELEKMTPHGGDVVFFNRCSRELNGKVVGFKGAGFAVMLGIVPPGVPAPPPIMVPRLMGEIGYLKFDDVISIFGEELGRRCVEAFKDKYYGKVVENPASPESEAVKAALQLVDDSGKPIQLLPGPSGKQ